MALGPWTCSDIHRHRLVAWYDIFAKFEGQSHATVVPFGGIGKSWKLEAFVKWERKRERAMRAGLALIMLGTVLGVVALWCPK